MKSHDLVRTVLLGDQRTGFGRNYLVSCTCGWKHQYYVNENEAWSLWELHRSSSLLKAQKRSWEIRCKFTGEAIESFGEQLLR